MPARSWPRSRSWCLSFSLSRSAPAACLRSRGGRSRHDASAWSDNVTSHFLIRSLDRGALAFIVVVLAIAVLVPFLNLAVPASSAFHLPTYLVALFGKYACYALLA